jgi:hypothetical protein
MLTKRDRIMFKLRYGHGLPAVLQVGEQYTSQAVQVSMGDVIESILERLAEKIAAEIPRYKGLGVTDVELVHKPLGSAGVIDPIEQYGAIAANVTVDEADEILPSELRREEPPHEETVGYWRDYFYDALAKALSQA